MIDDKVSYIRCRTCGRHIEENQSISKLYCSDTCARSFTRCPNCGKFFHDLHAELHNGFCSLECETMYDDRGIIISKKDQTESNNISHASDNETTIKMSENQILEEKLK
jgi:endogenous inhibitor of DNA gyrase (YacG/DUF329 family)